MIKNIFIILLISVIVSFSVTLLLDHYTYCESMFGLYYFSSTFYLLPTFFLLGLPVPIGLKKYTKEKSEYALKRKLCLTLGLAGMGSILSYFLVSFYSTAHSEDITNKYIKLPSTFGCRRTQLKLRRLCARQASIEKNQV